MKHATQHLVIAEVLLEFSDRTDCHVRRRLGQILLNNGHWREALKIYPLGFMISYIQFIELPFPPVFLLPVVFCGEQAHLVILSARFHINALMRKDILVVLFPPTSQLTSSTL